MEILQALHDNQHPVIERNYTWGPLGDGDAACDLATYYYGEPMPWQRNGLKCMLARCESGKLLHPSFITDAPRQNGKSWQVRGRVFYGITVLGERVLYTCHNQDTADEMFERFREPFESKDNVQLRSMSRIRYANGQGGVWYTDERRGVHGFAFFSTRSGTKARGKTNDVLIYDEAQELTRAQQKAASPSISAGARKDSQTIMLGTPPDENSRGDVLYNLRRRVLDGKSNAAFAEWGVSEVGDVSDRERWARVNPGWDYVLDQQAIESDYDTMDPEDFAIEHLGLWKDLTAEGQVVNARVITDIVWERSYAASLAGWKPVRRAFGVKFSQDGSSYALAGCMMDRDGRTGFEVIEVDTTARGTKGLARSLMSRAGSVSCVVVDGPSVAQVLCENMADAPISYVVRPSVAQAMQAYSALVEDLSDGSAWHARKGQDALDVAVSLATKRAIGRMGGWGFDGPGAHIVEACALALWGVRTTRRDPSRRQVIA